jgi:hypothetical protein
VAEAVETWAGRNENLAETTGTAPRLFVGQVAGSTPSEGARGPEGNDVLLIDGGPFDWLHELTSNRRLAFVASGMGAQLVAYLFHVER